MRYAPGMTDEDIDAALAQLPPDAASSLRAARRAIGEEAAALDPPQTVEASLKWGQPSLRAADGGGTAIRLGLAKSGAPALLVHCGTTLVADWAAARPEAVVEGNRALLIGPEGVDPLRPFIRAALTYRRRSAAARS